MDGFDVLKVPFLAQHRATLARCDDFSRRLVTFSGAKAVSRQEDVMDRRTFTVASVLWMGIAGCGATVHKAQTIESRHVDPGADEPVTHDDAPVELTTAVTTSGDELVASIERVTSPERLTPESRTSLLGPPPSDAGTTETRVRMGSWTCFARRTSKDERAMVFRTSKHGFLVVPIAWLAEVVQLPGVKQDDARAWYSEMSGQLATSGRARGLVRFDNGNAVTVSLELHDLDRADDELIAETHFVKAGEYDPKTWGAVTGGAETVKTKAMNKHRGISVFDLLRKLPGEATAVRATSI
jgi:hypothetical protein